MHVGFIKLHRKLLDWEWYSDTNVMRVFTHLLLVAYYEPTKKSGRLYQAGQLSIGRKQLSKAVGLSEQQVRTALKKLENTQEITIKATSEYSIITLNNWNSYQQNNQQITNDQPTTNQRLTTLKEVKKIRSKEDKNISKLIFDFEQFYNSLNDKKIRMTAQIQEKVKNALIDEDFELWKEVIEKSANKGHFINNRFIPLSAENMIDNYTKILEENYGLLKREESKNTNGDNYYANYNRV